MEITEYIGHLLDQKFAEDENLRDCFAVDIVLKPGQQLFVFVDSDSGINFDKCKTISRFLESRLDAEGPLGEKYVLEVSSPGIDRPLKFLRQYRKNVGRKLDVTLKDKSKREGVLTGVEDTRILLTRKLVVKEGNKKVETEQTDAITVDDIEKALVVPAF